MLAQDVIFKKDWVIRLEIILIPALNFCLTNYGQRIEDVPCELKQKNCFITVYARSVLHRAFLQLSHLHIIIARKMAVHYFYPLTFLVYSSCFLTIRPFQF